MYQCIDAMGGDATQLITMHCCRNRPAFLGSYASPSVCPSVWVCESYIAHHLVGTGLCCKPPTCVVHHRPALCTMQCCQSQCLWLESNSLDQNLYLLNKGHMGQSQRSHWSRSYKDAKQRQVGSQKHQVASLWMRFFKKGVFESGVFTGPTGFQNRTSGLTSMTKLFTESELIPAHTLRYIDVVFMLWGYVKMTFGFMLVCLVLFT